MARTFLHFFIGLAELAVLLAIFAGLVAVDWRDMDPCLSPDGERDLCYCEAFSGEAIRQPSNTWSALGFSLVGLLILASIGLWTSPGVNPMTRDVLYPAAFGYLAVYLGPGSMFFHATFSDVGGFLDSTSMYLFVSFVLVYELIRLTGMPRWAAGVLYGGLNLALLLLARLMNPTLLFGLLVALTGGIQIWVFAREGLRSSGWFFAGLGAFLAGLLIWGLAKTGGVLCSEDSVIQGHAIWHLLSAASVGCFYLYLRRAPDLRG